MTSHSLPAHRLRAHRARALFVIALLFTAPQMMLAGTVGEASITILSFNTWVDWTKVDAGFSKAAAAIRNSGADLVGLQESSPDGAQRMALELGWQRATGGDGSVQILSRHPIQETFTGTGIGSGRFIGARIRISQAPQREAILFNVHLDPGHYGPYAAQAAAATPTAVLAENLRSDRVSQIEAVLASMKSQLATADTMPVFLTGDFNGPSHLDWTTTTAAHHGGVGPVEWPESIHVMRVGLIDSFRHHHPDPATDPGNTWSPIHKGIEPQDRIDFIYHKGASLRVLDSRVFTTAVETTVGVWGSDNQPVKGNTWPSDHAAVLTRYGIGDSRAHGTGSQPISSTQNPEPN